MKKVLFAVLLLAAAANLASCSSGDSGSKDTPTPEIPTIPDKPDEDDATKIDTSIERWTGATADDAAKDLVGTDPELFWEANVFSTKVIVQFAGATATVKSSNARALCHSEGAYVTLDLETNLLKDVEVVVRGKSTDGGLKIYAGKRFKLTLAGVDLTSKRGPAINNQGKKRVFVHLADGSTNRLTDAATYVDDPYYIKGSSASLEDRKGCLFSEGNLLFSGKGVLVAEGRRKHAVATDGYLRMRPGATVAVTGAAGNGLQVKGDELDRIGVYVAGGLISAKVGSEAGKCIKTDLDVVVTGGKLLLDATGDSVYDSTKKDTSSPACIKAVGDVRIAGGTLTLRSTGLGGKGINVDGSLSVDGGVTDLSTTGGRFVHTTTMTSSPKGVKADGSVIVNGGEFRVSVTGQSAGSEGIECKSSLTINDGEVDCRAYDDAINAGGDVTVAGGKVHCSSVSNDGIDANGTLTVTGGVVIAAGAQQTEGGFDCDDRQFRITGGVVIGTGGGTSTPSASASTQRSVVYNGIRATKGSALCVRSQSGDPILVYELPATADDVCLLFSAPALKQGTAYEVLTGCTVPGGGWNGYHADNACSGGSPAGTFTPSGMVTTVGVTPGPNGRPGRF